MTPFLFGLALVLAIVHWITVYKYWHKAELFFKPAVMAVLLVLILIARPDFKNGLVFFAAAVFFSMLGDFLLLFPKRFILGLVMFLLAHLLYVLAFLIPFTTPTPLMLLLAILVALPALWLYRRVRAGLHQKGWRHLSKPILAYLVILSIMFLAALTTLFRDDWPIIAALLVSAGAFLFVVSDGLLAWNKFVRPLRTRRVGYMIAYHLGQMLIVAGALWRLWYF
jgi:uncharacterized membrane protein YhhN